MELLDRVKALKDKLDRDKYRPGFQMVKPTTRANIRAGVSNVRAGVNRVKNSPKESYIHPLLRAPIKEIGQAATDLGKIFGTPLAYKTKTLPYARGLAETQSKEYEKLVTDATTAQKQGRLKLAKELLDQAQVVRNRARQTESFMTNPAANTLINFENKLGLTDRMVPPSIRGEMAGQTAVAGFRTALRARGLSNPELLAKSLPLMGYLGGGLGAISGGVSGYMQSPKGVLNKTIGTISGTFEGGAEGVGSAFASAPKVMGLNTITQPIFDRILDKSEFITKSEKLSNFLTKSGRFVVGGATNLGEDQIYTLATEGRLPNVLENGMSILMGGVAGTYYQKPDGTDIEFSDGSKLEWNAKAKRWQEVATKKFAKGKSMAKEALIKTKEGLKTIDEWRNQKVKIKGMDGKVREVNIRELGFIRLGPEVEEPKVRGVEPTLKGKLYHGTNDINASKIQQEGFKPFSKDSGVSLTDDPKIAQKFAEATAKAEGGVPKVIEVDASQTKPRTYFDKPESLGATDREYTILGKDIGKLRVKSEPTIPGKITQDQLMLPAKATPEDAVFGKGFVMSEPGKAPTKQQVKAKIKQANKETMMEMPKDLDPSSWKDRGTFSLSRNTMARNIKKVFGKDAKKIKAFLIDPLRKNNKNMVEWTNNAKRETKKLAKEYGIKPRSVEDSLVQDYGEGNIGIEQLKKASPDKWKQIVEFADYFRKQYDDALDLINSQRTKYGYKPIPKRKDYFRHFQEIGLYTEVVGMLKNTGDIPTHLASVSDLFKTGKPFTTTELQRLGGSYTKSAIDGFDNYINSVGRQMFHIDTVQRGRMLEKFINETSKNDKTFNLQRYNRNLHEWTNLVAGKTSKIDQAIINYAAGRGWMKLADFVRRRSSANMVGGNIASAITNIIPLTQSIATTDKGAALKAMSEAIGTPFMKDVSDFDGVKSSVLTTRYAEGRIAPKFGEKISKTAGALFDAIDKFTARSVVGGKYYENLSKGMEPEKAMNLADDYATRLLAQRNIGELPNILNNRTFGMIAQFQTEVNNQWSFLSQDIPELGGIKAASAFAQIAILSTVYNNLYEKMFGRRPAIDPIYYGLMLAGKTEETEGTEFKERIGPTLMEASEGVPFYGTRLPVSSALPDVMALAKGESDLKKEMIKPATYLLPPTGGGQIKKGIEGYNVASTGVSTTPTGRIRYTLDDPTTFDKARLVIGGQWAAPEAQEYLRNMGKSEASITHAKLKNMDPAEANKIIKEIKKNDKSLYSNILKAKKDDDMKITNKEKTIRNLPIKDGSRALSIAKELNKQKTIDEKRELIKRYKELKIITTDVNKQLLRMKKDGKL